MQICTKLISATLKAVLINHLKGGANSRLSWSIVVSKNNLRLLGVSLNNALRFEKNLFV